MQRSLSYLALLALAACAKSPDAVVVIENAWSPAAPPGAGAIAVYAQIVSRQADTLVSVSTPAAASAELHSVTEEGGMMRMRPVENLAVAPGERVRLEPGGMHLMLMGLNAPMPVGTTIPLTFHFAEAGDIVATAQVRAADDRPE